MFQDLIQGSTLHLVFILGGLLWTNFLPQNSEEQCLREINFKVACEIDFRAES